jgi:chromosome segregation ATPase
MKSVVKFVLKEDIIVLFCTHASEYVHNLYVRALSSSSSSSSYGLFQVAGLERQNKQLQKPVSDLERTDLDVNWVQSNLLEENKSSKERLAKETEKCNTMASRLQPVETALSQASQEVADLKNSLVSLDTVVNNVFIILVSPPFFKNIVNIC